jgi:rhamnulokinase
VEQTSNHLAIDLGAESGRAVLGRWDGRALRCEEVHRFPNAPVWIGKHLHWDFPGIYRDVLQGLRRASTASGGRLRSVAVQSWGVDFGLIDRRGGLLANPVHYRDPRTSGVTAKVFRSIPEDDLFALTGVQCLELNTLFQLVALRDETPELLAAADKLLGIADLVGFFLSGRPAAEVTLASTTQLLDARRRTWSEEVLDRVGLPARLLPELVEPPAVLGPLQPDIAAASGLDDGTLVVASASHDTAAAVAAVPAAPGSRWAFLSSGTWSLLGLELPAPLLGHEAFRSGFTNECGVGGTTRCLRNLTGLWLVQECRREWAKEGQELGYDELARLAEDAGPASTLIDPNAKDLFTAGDMPRRIQDACRERGRPVPQTKGEVVRCILESLARSYAESLRAAEELTGRKLDVLHVVGGGSRHKLLNELTARATCLGVRAGPTEATALGSILLQAVAMGEMKGIEELRAVAAAVADCEDEHRGVRFHAPLTSPDFPVI